MPAYHPFIEASAVNMMTTYNDWLCRSIYSVVYRKVSAGVTRIQVIPSVRLIKNYDHLTKSSSTKYILGSCIRKPSRTHGVDCGIGVITCALNHV